MIPSDDEQKPSWEGPGGEGSLRFDLCRRPQVRDAKISPTWILRNSHRRKVCEMHSERKVKMCQHQGRD